jgi:hypothetical protein
MQVTFWPPFVSSCVNFAIFLPPPRPPFLYLFDLYQMKDKVEEFARVELEKHQKEEAKYIEVLLCPCNLHRSACGKHVHAESQAHTFAQDKCAHALHMCVSLVTLDRCKEFDVLFCYSLNRVLHASPCQTLLLLVFALCP